MSRNVKIIIAILFIVLVILACILGTKNKENEDVQNTSANTVNEIVENVVDEDETENVDQEKNTVKNNNVSTTDIPDEQHFETKKPEDNVYETSSDVGTTDKKQEAIDLVKKVWGEDNTVTFRCDSVSKDGIYTIAVVSNTQARVLNYYAVNLETKSVEVDY